MSSSRDHLLTTVKSAYLQAMDEQGATPPASLDDTTVLFGPGAPLDSLGLVTLLAEVEQRLDEEQGVVVVLTDERAMSRRNSPFRTLGSLVDHICAQLAADAA